MDMNAVMQKLTIVRQALATLRNACSLTATYPPTYPGQQQPWPPTPGFPPQPQPWPPTPGFPGYPQPFPQPYPSQPGQPTPAEHAAFVALDSAFVELETALNS